MAFVADTQRYEDISRPRDGDFRLRLWDTTTNSLLQTLTGHSDEIRASAFSPDGHVVITDADNEVIRVWNATNGNVQASYSLGARLFCLELHPWRPVAIGGGASGMVY